MRSLLFLLYFALIPESFLADESSGPGIEFKIVPLEPESTYSAAAISDIDLDGDLDIISGGWWYEAPVWKKRFVREVQEINGRFDGYTHLPIDMDGDGDEDFINVNYRSKSIFWVERPDNLGTPWPRHVIAIPGSMENGFLVDLDEDGVQDILPNGARFAGWWRGKVVNESPRRLKFEAHSLLEELTGHGLGFGDIDGDGLDDLVGVSGWAKAPEDRVNGKWEWFPEFFLEKRASVPVIVRDVDGDGDSDIVWSSGHDYGVFWLEQEKNEEGARGWTRHEIDLSWSQGHTPIWADLDGDGTGEFVCGKRYYAHEGKDPGAEDELVIYRYQFDPARKTWDRHEISRGSEVGWGLSPAIADVDGDGDLDLVCPGRSGLYLLLNSLVSGDS